MLISFVLLGKYLETVAKGKTSEAIRKLMSLQPSTALLMVTDENGRILEEKSIEIDLVQRGDTLKGKKDHKKIPRNFHIFFTFENTPTNIFGSTSGYKNTN